MVDQLALKEEKDQSRQVVSKDPPNAVGSLFDFIQFTGDQRKVI